VDGIAEKRGKGKICRPGNHGENEGESQKDWLTSALKLEGDVGEDGPKITGRREGRWPRIAALVMICMVTKRKMAFPTLEA